MFSVSDDWKKAYPAAHAGVLILRGVVNPAMHAGLQEIKGQLESELRARFAGKTRADIAEEPLLKAYAAYYRRFDKTYHVQGQLESIVLKGKPIPTVAALVEAMFMAEVGNLLLTAGHDLDSIRGSLTLDVAKGDERYTLMRGAEQTLKAGDMFIRDGDGVLSSIVYGPDSRTAIRPETRAAVFTVYAPNGVPAEAVLRHLDDIRRYAERVSPDLSVEMLKVAGAV